MVPLSTSRPCHLFPLYGPGRRIGATVDDCLRFLPLRVSRRPPLFAPSDPLIPPIARSVLVLPLAIVSLFRPFGRGVTERARPAGPVRYGDVGNADATDFVLLLYDCYFLPYY